MSKSAKVVLGRVLINAHIGGLLYRTVITLRLDLGARRTYIGFPVWTIVVRFAMPLITRSTTGVSLTETGHPSLLHRRTPMDDPNNTTGTLEADEDILTYTVSDEAIEAAAGGGGTTPMCTSVAVPCPTSEFPAC